MLLTEAPTSSSGPAGSSAAAGSSALLPAPRPQQEAEGQQQAA